MNMQNKYDVDNIIQIGYHKARQIHIVLLHNIKKIMISCSERI